ncbi:MAG: futalosine hydrolase [Bacteroidota bacterium]
MSSVKNSNFATVKIMIIAATKKEVETLLQKMDKVKNSLHGDFLIECHYKQLEVDIAISGVGMVAATHCTTILNNMNRVATFNIGICGSFNRNLEIGTVVNVVEDCIAEMGAEDGENFLSLEEMGINEPSRFDVRMPMEKDFNPFVDLLPKVNGITVNTVHGNEKSIDKVVARLHPMVESMEGAGFLYSIMSNTTPYAQIRAVSNFVEQRNKNAWNIPLAINNLTDKMIEILDYFSTK